MTKIITKTDLFNDSILHRDTYIIVKGEEKIRNEILPFLRLKSKNYIAESFLRSKNDKDSLIADGWEFKPKTKHPKTKWKVTKMKNDSVYFEDRVWSLFANMGASQLNINSNETKLPYGNNKDKKIDVFAVIENVILIVECKCAENPNTLMSGNKIIDEIAEIKKGSEKFLNKLYPNHKVIFGLATKNYRIGEALDKRIKDENIYLLDENKLEYYEYLNKSLAKASRYQFFAEIFNKEEVHGFDGTQVNAIQKENKDGSTTYTFFIKAKDLLRIAYVFHTEAFLDTEKKGYQRLVKPARRKQVENYIKNGGFFPNSLIVSLNEEITYDKIDDIDPFTEMGTLTLPNKYASAFIIDGQHRLYGYANLDDKFDDVIPVTAFTDLDTENQVQLFIDINSKQKPVSPSLLLDLRSDLWWGSENVNEAISALRTRLITNLGSTRTSALQNRIKIGQKLSTKLRCITVDYLLKYGINKTNFFGKYRGRTYLEDGWFLSKRQVTNKNYNKALNQSQKFLEYIFGKIQEKIPEMWNAGNDKQKKTFIAMNVGVFTVIRLCDHILRFRKKEGDDFTKMKAEEIGVNVWTHLECVIEHIGQLDKEALQTYRSYSTGGINEKAVNELLVVLSNNNSNIKPDVLINYLKDKESKFNQLTPPITRELEIIIQKIIKNSLKEKYPIDEQWYQQGVPNDIQGKAAVDHINNNRKGKQWNYLYLLDYQKIILTNKNELLPIFTQPGEEQMKEKDKLKWFVKLNKIRNKASHPTREPIIENEYNFVFKLKEWLINK
jgi:DNA sulfur modification protein DndB